VAISSRFKKFVVYFIVLIFGISLLTFVGSVYHTNSVSIKSNQIVIPADTLDYDLVLRYAKLFYPEFEFITRNSPRKYSMDDFINNIFDSIQISKNFKNPIGEDMTKNWNETFGEKLTQKDFVVVACFWSKFVSDFYGFKFPNVSVWNDWKTELSIEILAKNLLSMWIWDSFAGKTNGDKWYEIPHLKPAIFFGWSIQNNSVDVMRKNVNWLRIKYRLDFEMVQDVGLFQGLGIGAFWHLNLLQFVCHSSGNETPTIRELAITNWVYNPSTRIGDCKTGQYWRDILTISFGEKDFLWYFYGLDSKAVDFQKSQKIENKSSGLLGNVDREKLDEFLKKLP